MSYQTHPNARHTALSIEMHTHPGAIIIALQGEADLPGVEDLDRKLTVVLAQRPARLLFDITQLQMISSMCMGSLLRTKQAVERSHGHCELIARPGLVLDALKRARLTDLFKQFDSVEAALAQAVG